MNMAVETSLNPNQAQLLRQQPLFSNLSEPDWELILNSSHVRKLTKGAYLFRKGDVSSHFYMLLTGQIKLVLLSEGGEEKIVTIINHPICFAEAMMLGSVPYCPLSAQAIDDTQVICIESAVYRNLLLHSPQACLQTISSLSKRLHWMINEIDQLTLHNATYRLVCYLTEVAQQQAAMSLDVPKAVIAARISVKPETLSRILKQLQDDQLIENDAKGIRIINLAGLRSYLE